VGQQMVIEGFLEDERIEEIVEQEPGEITITDGLSYGGAENGAPHCLRQLDRWKSSNG
jgi:hypothetical protein